MEGECEYDHEHILFVYSGASMTTRTSVVIALTTMQHLSDAAAPHRVLIIAYDRRTRA